MGLITCAYCTGIFMCAGLLLQDDEGSPVQHAKGAPSLPFWFGFFGFFFFPLEKKSTIFHFNPRIFVSGRTKEKLSQSQVCSYSSACCAHHRVEPQMSSKCRETDFFPWFCCFPVA